MLHTYAYISIQYEVFTYSVHVLVFSDDNQVLLVQLGCLPALHVLIQKSRGDTLTVATACLRNLSIHKTNEVNSQY